MSPREKPILFSAPMVRAILAGTKTQTRRIIRNPGFSEDAWRSALPHHEGDGGFGVFGSTPYLRIDYDEATDRSGQRIRCPYGAPGDRLWVRETWCQKADETTGRLIDGQAHYAADGYEVVHVDDHCRSPWRPSIYMPRWASRITLEVLSVRIERLHAITEEDAQAEGLAEPVNGHPIRGALIGNGPSYREAFAQLWEDINGKRAPWSANPWVWRVEFRRLP